MFNTSLLVPILLFIAGLVLLIKGGDWFVDGSVGIAHRLKMSELLIGATVVSIGTTLPEVLVSATSAVEGHGEISYGNAIGSIICNTALIAALTIAIKPAPVNKKTLRIPVIFFFSAAALYMVTSYVFGTFSRITGIILLLIFAAYMTVNVITAKKNTEPEPQDEIPNEKQTSAFRDILLLIIGAACIAGGAKLLVDNGIIIAEKFGVPESVIALTFIALGTSLPELVTAITSLVKGHGALSLGNIIGANIFNLVLVSGLSVVLNPFDVPASKLINGMNASLVVDLPLMALVMLIMTLPALIKGKLYRAQGIILLLIYAGFCVFQFAF